MIKMITTIRRGLNYCQVEYLHRTTRRQESGQQCIPYRNILRVQTDKHKILIIVISI